MTILRRSGLNYTILHPGALTNAAGSGKIEAAQYFDGKGEIPREDVENSVFIKEIVTSNHFNHQEFQLLHSGTLKML